MAMELDLIHASIIAAPFAAIVGMGMKKKNTYSIRISCWRQGIDSTSKTVEVIDGVPRKMLRSTLKDHGITKVIEQVLRGGKANETLIDEKFLDSIFVRTTFKFSAILRSRTQSRHEDIGLYDHYFCTITPKKGVRR